LGESLQKFKVGYMISHETENKKEKTKNGSKSKPTTHEKDVLVQAAIS
jgi:hypothetical protein